METAQSVFSNLKDFTQYELTAPIDLIGFSNLQSSKSFEMLNSVIFRELYLLHDGAKSTSMDREAIAREISNKIARLWFGVTVSPAYWDHAWIVNGMAKFLEASGIAHKVHFALADQFGVAQLQTALVADSVEGSHACLNKDLATLEKLQNGASDEDLILNHKSAVILRWIESIVGSEKFMTKLREFFKEK